MGSNYAHLLYEKNRYIKDNQVMVLSGIIGVLLAYFMLSSPSFPKEGLLNWNSLLTIYGVAFYFGFSFIAGWKLLHGFTARYFVVLPLIGWLIYIFLKFAFALIIGANFFYGIFRFLNNLYKIQKINQSLR
ncbi:hypothetical protein [Myroides sp. LJL119]